MLQVLPEHEAEALAYEQAWPQEPQLPTSVVVFTSQPLAALPSQLA